MRESIRIYLIGQKYKTFPLNNAISKLSQGDTFTLLCSTSLPNCSPFPEIRLHPFPMPPMKEPIYKSHSRQSIQNDRKKSGNTSPSLSLAQVVTSNDTCIEQYCGRLIAKPNSSI